MGRWDGLPHARAFTMTDGFSAVSVLTAPALSTMQGQLDGGHVTLSAAAAQGQAPSLQAESAARRASFSSRGRRLQHQA